MTNKYPYLAELDEEEYSRHFHKDYAPLYLWMVGKGSGYVLHSEGRFERSYPPMRHYSNFWNEKVFKQCEEPPLHVIVKLAKLRLMGGINEEEIHTNPV